MSADEDTSKGLSSNLIEGTKMKVNTEFFDYFNESRVGPGFPGQGKNFVTIKKRQAKEGEKSPCTNLNNPQYEAGFRKKWFSLRETMMNQRLENIEQCRKRDLELHNQLNAALGKELQLLIRANSMARTEVELKTMECEEKNKKCEELEAGLKDIQEKLLRMESELEDVKNNLVEKDQELEEMKKSSSKKDEKIEMMDIELSDLRQKVNRKDVILHQAAVQMRKQKVAMSRRDYELSEKEKVLEVEKRIPREEISVLQRKDEETKKFDANLIPTTKEEFVKQKSRLSKLEMKNTELQSSFAKSSRSSNQLYIELESFKNYLNREFEVDLEVIYECFAPFIEHELSFTESEEDGSYVSEGDYIPKMVRVDEKLLEKVKPYGIRKRNQIDVFVRLVESSLVKDGVMLRLDVTWDIMTLVRAGIAGWQWMLCNEEETEELRALRANRRINWVMGIDTNKHSQVKSAAMLKGDLGVKFAGNHLSRKIQDYPMLLKHNAKVWIISRDFMNVKPSPTSNITYCQQFWKRAKTSSRGYSYKARVMPRKSMRKLFKSAADLGDMSPRSPRTPRDKKPLIRKISNESKVSSNNSGSHRRIQCRSKDNESKASYMGNGKTIFREYASSPALVIDSVKSLHDRRIV